MSDLRDLLIEEQETLMLPIVDKVYAQAYEYLQIRNMIKLAYSAGKILTIPVFLPMAEHSSLCIWFVCAFLLSSLQFIQYLRFRKLTSHNDVYYKIAQRLGHLSQMPQILLSNEMRNAFPRIGPRQDYLQSQQGALGGQQGQQQRRMRFLAHQIKGQLQKESPTLFLAGRIQFILYQLIHVWGVMLFFLLQDNQLAMTYLSILIFLSTYEYLEFYLLLFFLLLVLPFWLLKSLYNHVRHRYKLYRLERMLKGFAFYKGAVKDDEQCKICLQEYKDNQDIVVLKCSQFHHFHASCIRLWADNALTCPICRGQVNPS